MPGARVGRILMAAMATLLIFSMLVTLLPNPGV